LSHIEARFFSFIARLKGRFNPIRN